MAKLNRGYKVVGPNTVNGQLHCWHFDSLELANPFAKQLAQSTGAEILVLKAVGIWQLAAQPVEFLAAEEAAAPDKASK